MPVNYRLLSAGNRPHRMSGATRSEGDHRKVLQTAALRPESEELGLALRVESNDEQRSVGERLRIRCFFQNQAFVAAQQGDAIDALRNIRPAVIVDRCSIGRPGEGEGGAAFAIVRKN
jgi:hypothetical protein